MGMNITAAGDAGGAVAPGPGRQAGLATAAQKTTIYISLT